MGKVTLADLKPGESAKIVAFAGLDRAYRQRLMAMGLTPSTTITVVRRAPFGDPIEIEVRGSLLSLRQPEAAMMQLERLV